MTLMLHCGANPATMTDLSRVTLPESTPTFQPIAHDLIAQMTLEAVRKQHPGADINEAYGMTAEGNRMFGVLDVILDGSDHGPCYGMRNDHGKTLSSAVCGGGKVFVCDNLAFSSDGVTFFRKHTKNIVRDLETIILKSVQQSAHEFSMIEDRWEAMRDLGVSLNTGYGMLGIAAGTGVLTPTQFNQSRRAWRDDERHGPRTQYSLYQAFTEGAKKGNPADMMTRYPKIDDFFRNEECLILWEDAA